jgi:hypothetical protein
MGDDKQQVGPSTAPIPLNTHHRLGNGPLPLFRGTAKFSISNPAIALCHKKGDPLGYKEFAFAPCYLPCFASRLLSTSNTSPFRAVLRSAIIISPYDTSQLLKVKELPFFLP